MGTRLLPILALLTFACGGAPVAIPHAATPREATETTMGEPETTVERRTVLPHPERTCEERRAIPRANDLAVLAIPSDGKPWAVAWEPKTAPADARASKGAWSNETTLAEGLLTTHDRRGISIRETEIYKSGYGVTLHQDAGHYSLRFPLPRKSHETTPLLLGMEFRKVRLESGVDWAERFSHGEVRSYLRIYQEPEWSFVVSERISPMLLANAWSPSTFGEVLKRNHQCVRETSESRLPASEWTGIFKNPLCTLFVSIADDDTAETAIACTENSVVRVTSYHVSKVRHVKDVSLSIGEAYSDLYILITLKRTDAKTTAGIGLISWRDGEGQDHNETLQMLASLDGESWAEAMIEALTTERSIEEWWQMQDRLLQRRIDQMDRVRPAPIP